MIINFAFELFFSLFGNTRSSASRDAYRDNCTIFCHFFFLLLFFLRERDYFRWREFLGLIVGTMSESCSFFWEYEKLISIVRNS